MKQDLFALYQLPPIDRAPIDSNAYVLLSGAKVLRYAREMPVSFSEITAPEDYLISLRSDILSNITQKKTAPTCSFSGNTAGELNSFLNTINLPAKVVLTSETLVIDTSVKLKDGVYLQGYNTTCLAEGVDNAFLAEGCSDFEITGLSIQGAQVNAVLLINCTNVTLKHLNILDGKDYGIILKKQCSYITIEHCIFVNNMRSGIMVHEGSHHTYISHCEVTGIRHSSNWAAGIVITALESTSLYQTQDAFEVNYFYPNNLEVNIPSVPYQNIVEKCSIHHNQSSGVYVDGGNGNVIYSNTIEYNDKEGMCLDFYAATNIVLSNTISANGHRQHQSDHALDIDCVKEFGRLSDGSSTAKLPNISLDNAGLNIILKNTISNAGGDGIKMVRAAFKNLIGLNVIADNNQGENHRFKFSGILLGSAGCEVENDSSGLDRLPSIENMIFGNMIFGQHVAGIVYDTGSTYNDTIDNLVMKQKSQSIIKNAWPNSIVGNNFTCQTNSIPILQQILRRIKHIIRHNGLLPGTQ